MKRNQFSRRFFLQSLAATTVSVPWLVRGRALGLEDAAPASERITLGHIGWVDVVATFCGGL